MVKGFFTPATSAFTPTKNSIILFATCLLLLLGAGRASAATTYTATQSGNWNAVSTWGGSGYPQAGDNAIINQNYTVTLTTAAACTNLSFGGNAGVIVLGSNNLSISGNLTLICNAGTFTTTTGYVIFNGTSQSINLCTGGGNSIPNLRLANNTSVSMTPQTNLTVTNFDCQTGNSSFSNSNASGWSSGSFIITGTCTAPNCTFIAGTNINGTSMDFTSCTSNPIQVGGVIDSQPTAIIDFGSKNVVVTGSYSGTHIENIHYSGTVIAPISQTFSTSGSFTVPAGVTSIKVEAWGAGGGGAGSTNNSGGSGGGGGAYSTNISSVTPGQVISYTVGTGGAGGAWNANSGTAGSSSTILTLTASGGTGGTKNGGTAGTGGSASGGTTNKNGVNGVIGVLYNGGNGGNGGNGATGGAGTNTSVGGNGNAPGGGGGGAYALYQSGGSGGNGQVVITYLASITGATSIPVGSTTTLSNAVTGGTWTSANPAVATINSSGVVTGVSAGTSLITYTALGLSITTTVTVYAPCNYGTTVSSGITFTPVIDMTSHVQQVSTTFKSGQHFVMNVIKGLTYQVYTTSSPTSALKMTVYDEGNASGPVLASSISNAGNSGGNANDVYLSFTSPLSGQVRVMISLQSNCSATTTTGLTVNTNVSGGSNTQDDQTAAGTDSWIGHLYDSQSTTTRLDNYLGYYAVTGLSGDPSSFQEMFGTIGTFPSGTNDDATGFNVYSNGNIRAQVLDYTFGVRYRMNSTKRGFYTVTIASDDGVRLSIDGNSVYNHWDDHSPVTNTNMLLSLKGSSSLVLDYYEQGGQNIIGFYNLVQLFSNTLSTNTSQALCKGTSGATITGDDFPTTLPSNITNGGYQWYYSTPADPTRKIITGANTATFTPIASAAPFNNIVGVYYLYRNATLNSTYNSTTVPTSPSGNPYNASATNESNAVTVRIKGCPNYWIGGAAPVSTTWNSSTDWNTASNWSDGIPYPGDDVEFATTANSGNAGSDAKNNMVLDNNYIVGGFKNQSMKQLIVAPATSLTVNAAITTDNNNQIYIQSNGSQPNGSLIFPNATNVKATVEMYSKATHGAGITVGTNTYFYTWQYFGIPLTSVVASPTFDGSFVRKNDEASSNTLGKWTSLVNADVLDPFKGYEITQDAPTTIVFQGTLVNAGKSIDLAYTSTAYDPGQNMLANPYTAAIDIRQLTFASTTTVENAVYLYNTGSFGQWSNNNGETTYDTGTNLAGQYIAIPQSAAGTGSIPYDIPSMSAFMVKAIRGPVSGGVKINYSSVITKNVNPQRAPQSKVSSDKVYLEVSLRGEHYGDRMWLINEPGTTRGFDNGWDGYKLSGAVGTPKLFAMEESGNYQISTSSDLNNTYLGFQAGIDLEDTLTFKSENLGLKYDGVYLVDLVENKIVDITKSGTQYAFKAESTAAPVKRFKITTEAYVKDAQDLTTQIKVFNDNDAVFVDNSSNQKGELYFYDLMGRYIKKEIFGPTSISSFPLSSVSGVYVVKAVTTTEKVSKKIIVNKQSE